MRTELSYDNAIFWANRQYELLKQEAALEVRIAALKYELERTEADVLGSVTAEREDNKPRFGNEQARKAELARRLELDEDYQRSMAELNALNKDSMFLQREAKLASKIVEIMCTFAQKQQEPLIPIPASMLLRLSKQESGEKVMVQIPDIQELSDEDEEFSAA